MIVSNEKRGVVLDLAEGQDLNNTKTLLNRTLGDKKAVVETIITDMW